MADNRLVHTVQGPIPTEKVGVTLIHEHLLVDFVGAASYSRGRYDLQAVVERMLPFLGRLRELGVRTFVECTPMYLGRDPLLLRRLSEESGIQIVTNTGLYAAGEREGSLEPYLPAYAYRLSAEELAGGWLKEYFEGIEGTGVRPGFIKIGVNRGSLRPISEKVVQAAIATSHHTGLAIAAHTASGVGALRILDLLEQASLPASRYIFVHAQAEESLDLQLQCARRGAWMEFDGVSPDSAERHLQLILRLLEEGFENQLLISQDAGWYRPGEPDGGNVRGFEFLLQEFIPLLRSRGVPAETVDHLLIHNPAAALGVPAE